MGLVIKYLFSLCCTFAFLRLWLNINTIHNCITLQVRLHTNNSNVNFNDPYPARCVYIRLQSYFKPNNMSLTMIE